jgi:hypothetical protein
MNTNPKYFFFFRSDLRSHVHFFENLCSVANSNGVPMKLITFLSPRVYYKQYNLVKKYRDKTFRIFISAFPNVSAVFYFFIQSLFTSKLIIHVKKRDLTYLFFLKKILGEKLLLIIDLEGDAKSERDYLLHNPYKSSFYENELRSLKEQHYKEKEIFNKVDKILVLNNNFKELLLSRYSNLNEKIMVGNIMSFRKGTFMFDLNSRKKYRKKIGWCNNHIICYIGNVHYSWQNISKTIILYKRIKNELYFDSKLLLLIRKQDHEIAISFLNQHNINSSDYLLTEVPNSEIINYMSASDLGVSLRDFHVMNSIVTSGKLIDYLGCGLPVITTSILYNIPEVVSEQKFGIVLDDLDFNKVDMEEVRRVIDYDSVKRELISKWANNNLSIDSEIGEYLTTIKK